MDKDTDKILEHLDGRASELQNLIKLQIKNPKRTFVKYKKRKLLVEKKDYEYEEMGHLMNLIYDRLGHA